MELQINDIPRIAIALKAQAPQFAGLTDEEVIKKFIGEQLKAVTSQYEANQAAQKAMQELTIS